MKSSRPARSALTTVYVTAPVLTPPGLTEPVPVDTGARRCFRLHRVQWKETRWSTDGESIVLRFLAPDAEAVRLALRNAGISYATVSTRNP